MKKFLIFIILFVILPTNIFAASVTGATITGDKSGNGGDKIYITFDVNLSGLDPSSTDKDGIVYIFFNFHYDDRLLYLTEVESDLNTLVFYNTDKKIHQSISSISENMANACSDKVLFCGNNHKIKLEFKVANNELTEITDYTVIKLDKILLGTLKVGEILNMSDNDISKKTKFTEYPINIEHKISVRYINGITYTEPDTVVKETPEKDTTETIKDIIPEIKKETPTPKDDTTPTTPSPPKKSSNTNLSKLEVKNYDIGFTKEKDYYELYIDDENVNSLEVLAELEDSKSTYEIKGSDDLKASNNRITIDVSSENGDKKTYTINVKTKHVYKEKEKEETVKIFNYEIKKRYVKYAIIAFIIIVVLIILKVVITILKDRLGHRKYYKAIKNIEK